MMIGWPRYAAVFAAILASANAAALEFRSIAEPAAILYDAPSSKAQKVFILSQGYPVEVVVKLEGWTKVRDDAGDFAWIENSHLSDRRTVMVKVASAEARHAASESSPVVFTAEKSVVLKWSTWQWAGPRCAITMVPSGSSR